MKIYFAGSIRGGRDDAELYSRIAELLNRYGRVLTGHVSDPNPDQETLSDPAIYQRDMKWLAQADALVAEVTVPSHGVGYEIAAAEALGKPVLCLHRPDSERRLSALLSGNHNIHCRTYRQLEELEVILRAFFSQSRFRSKR